MRNYYFILILILLFANNYIYSENNLGTLPIIGAVTESSATLVFKSTNEMHGAIQLSKDTSFNYLLNFPFSVTEHWIKLKLDKLEANTLYYYRIVDENETNLFQSSFTTFPLKNTSTKFSFAFGSCINLPYADSIFKTILQHQPKFFMQLGDWIYPKKSFYSNSDSSIFFAIDNMDNIKKSYELKYSLPNLSALQHQIPIDYIYDDEDFIKDDCSKSTYTKISHSNNSMDFEELTYPTTLKSNIIQSYQHFFPNYPLEASSSAYHSFVYGNAEFFVLDTRGTRDANTTVFTQKKNGKYKYQIPSSHEIIDSNQLNWLLNGLINSKANWKFIVSSVAYNPALKKLMDLCMMNINQQRKLPNGQTALEVAIQLSALWCAFPATNKKLIDYIRANHIQNVLVLSGDAHTALLENQKNSTLPELMAGALAQENSQLGKILHQQLKLNVFNKGQGIDNNIFNNAFGNVMVYGNDSIQLQAIDDKNQLLFSSVVDNGYLPPKFKYRKNSKITIGDKTRSFFKMIGIYLRNKKQLHKK